MSKSNARPSLAERLAAVAGPPAQPAAMIEKEIAQLDTARATAIQAPRVKKPVAVAPAPEIVTAPKARDGKVMVAGYFSPQMAKAVKLLAVDLPSMDGVDEVHIDKDVVEGRKEPVRVYAAKDKADDAA